VFSQFPPSRSRCPYPLRFDLFLYSQIEQLLVHLFFSVIRTSSRMRYPLDCSDNIVDKDKGRLLLEASK
jgi:hypothetical protein